MRKSIEQVFAISQCLNQSNLELIFGYLITTVPICSISRQSSTKRGQPYDNKEEEQSNDSQ